MATDAVIYRWYLDGTLTETTPTPTIELDSDVLSPGTTYHIKVTGVDAAGNESGYSDEYVLTTLASTATSSRRMKRGFGA